MAIPEYPRIGVPWAARHAPVDDRYARALRATGHLDAGFALLRERLDDARAQADACALAAVIASPCQSPPYSRSASRRSVTSSIASSEIEPGLSSNTWRAFNSIMRRPIAGNACSTSYASMVRCFG
jgi:hypothetical protein